MMNLSRLLMVDCVGALVTFFVTAIMFATGLVPTGLPTRALCCMALFAAVFCLIGLACLLFASDVRKPLRLLAVLNMSYGIGTIVLCVLYFNELTKWGLAYFPIEVVVIIALASLEWFASIIPMKR